MTWLLWALGVMVGYFLIALLTVYLCRKNGVDEAQAVGVCFVWPVFWAVWIAFWVSDLGQKHR